jgi:pimeloyl-ACP methyl ester carboxylesterase
VKAIALIALVLASSSSLAAEKEGVYRRRVTTADHVGLAMFRYVPVGGGARKPPVVLIPELGMGREAFDLDGAGLARWLQHQGREVFVLEPRGHGRSEAPKDWRLSDIVRFDLPAAIAVIRAERPGKIDFVGHGYGGSLVLAALAGELGAAAGKVVALATPVEPEVASPLLGSLLRSGGHFGTMSSDPQAAQAFEMLFAAGGRFSRACLSQLRGLAFSDLGRAASKDLLGWMESGDLALADATTFLERLGRYDRPTLLFLPLHNNFVHPEYASPLRELTRAPVKTHILTRLDLLAEDYSHLSLIHGIDAAADVYAPALRFLDEAAQQ